ncbi:MAG: PadR family transcriptional regulator [Acidimicrobiales bacterium]
MLELAVLGLLKEHPMHGYDLRKQLRRGSVLLGSLSFGSLYPALARLDKAGAVREVDAAQALDAEVIPLTGLTGLKGLTGSTGKGSTGSTGAGTGAGTGSTGSLTGERAAFRARLAARAASTARSASGTRGRKVYEITTLGEQMFERLLTSDDERSDDERGFALRWSFARYLSRESRLRLLERRRRLLDEQLVAMRRESKATEASADRFKRSLADHAAETLARDLSWVESLIAAEQAGSADPASETEVS